MPLSLLTNENYSSPIPLLHPGDISAAEAYTTEHIDLEDVAPILVREVIERLGLINSEVVDENVHGGKAFGQVSCRLRRREVPRKSVNVGLRNILTDLFQGGIDRGA